MEIIKSKYKIFGGLTLLIAVNIGFALITYKVISNLYQKCNVQGYEWQDGDFIVSGILILFQLLSLFLLMKDCRYIIIEGDRITFINALLPFIRKTVRFNEYDYKQTVREYSRAGYYEAVWLIKNGKLKTRIFSFYYSNYEELKHSINTPNKGSLKINQFKQLGCLLGMKV